MTEYRGYHIEQAHIPGCRKAYLISCTWGDDLEGVPAFRTLSATKKAIDQLERGEFHFRFPTRQGAIEWRNENHCKWEVKQAEDDWFEVIPDEWHRKLYQEIDWDRVTCEDVFNAVSNSFQKVLAAA